MTDADILPKAAEAVADRKGQPFMIDSSRQPGQQLAPWQPTGVHVDGLALRYVPILCDMTVSDATYATCYKDEIIFGLPEGQLIIRIIRRERRHLLLAFEVDFRSPKGGNAWRARWDLTVAGDPGSGRQRAMIIREITRLRHHYARTGKNTVPTPGRQEPHHGAPRLWQRFAAWRLARTAARTES